MDELREIRRIWLQEKHEFQDSLPRIFEEVTGRGVSQARQRRCRARRGGLGDLERDLRRRRGLFHAADRVTGHRAAVSRDVARGRGFTRPWRTACGPGSMPARRRPCGFAREQTAQREAVKRRPAEAAEPEERGGRVRAATHVVRRRAGEGLAMILERLTLCNFCLYRGEQTFNLAPQRRNGKGRPSSSSAASTAAARPPCWTRSNWPCTVRGPSAPNAAAWATSSSSASAFTMAWRPRKGPRWP